MTTAAVGMSAVGIGVNKTVLDALFKETGLADARLDYQAGHVRDAVGMVSCYAHNLIEKGTKAGDDEMVAKGEDLRSAAYNARLTCSINVA